MSMPDVLSTKATLPLFNSKFENNWGLFNRVVRIAYANDMTKGCSPIWVVQESIFQLDVTFSYSRRRFALSSILSALLASVALRKSYCQIWCLRIFDHAAIWLFRVISIPSLNVMPVMTLARKSKPRSFLQFCSAHCPRLNLM
jgi:hypothetical protein